MSIVPAGRDQPVMIRIPTVHVDAGFIDYQNSTAFRFGPGDEHFKIIVDIGIFRRPIVAFRIKDQGGISRPQPSD